MLEGEEKLVKFVGNRIAFSCIGRVTSLNGEPEKFITVQAISSVGNTEETQTDSLGNYRIRGLVPGNKYTIQLKLEDHLERSSPYQIDATVIQSDVSDANFIVFRKVRRYDITGIVHADDQWLHTLEVKLYDEERASPDNVLIKKLGPGNFFHFSSLPNSNYHIAVSTSLSSRLYTSTEDVKVIENLKWPRTHVELKFNTSFIQDSQDVPDQSIWGLVSMVGMVLVFFYWKWIVELIKKFRSEVDLIKNKKLSLIHI
eukprot:TRINITY_DN6190_c0_g1_i1.p1 TRINITY_DN6190_c0_g1~~TRINITY_DN6190_c0_g1_i1.p1  ORF type:complete len:257 (-),score=42.83 TRINITY_DN6190_c0_g1_i1:2-772(-)